MREFGANQMTAQKRLSEWIRFLMQFHQPLIYILLISTAISAGMGKWVDAAVIFGVASINAIVGYLQEAKAEKAIEAMANMVVTEATVRRGGAKLRIASLHLVPGDVVLLQSGAIALAVGAIPEGLPAVGTLGSTTVICPDKTVTLTQNQMTVQEILAGGRLYHVTGSGYELVGKINFGQVPVVVGENVALIETLGAGLLCTFCQRSAHAAWHAAEKRHSATGRSMARRSLVKAGSGKYASDGVALLLQRTRSVCNDQRQRPYPSGSGHLVAPPPIYRAWQLYRMLS